ncbi:MAG: CBS domain-containing protein [Gammaproteobacteria bacterium]|jgi:acetoin utilization protein AcuB|nr:CBS domain-containing protein [Gammaproteobacteria bacterium]NCF80543.1 CBS domain-containing protein [Pseudomonadota bacterium]
MYVKDVMQSVVTTAPKGTPVQDAFEIMRDGGFRHLPVLDEFGKVAGILSDRDLRSVGAVYKDEATGSEDFLVTEDTTVDKIMATKPYSVSPEDSVSFAIDIIKEKRIGCLIVSKGGELLGILSYMDLLAALKQILEKPARESAA